MSTVVLSVMGSIILCNSTPKTYNIFSASEYSDGGIEATRDRGRMEKEVWGGDGDDGEGGDDGDE